jgi:hypothetical protein
MRKEVRLFGPHLVAKQLHKTAYSVSWQWLVWPRQVTAKESLFASAKNLKILSLYKLRQILSSRQSAHKGGKVVSLSYRPLLPPRGIVLVLISVRFWADFKARMRPKRLSLSKMPMTPIGIRENDFPACSVVPQRSSPQPTPFTTASKSIIGPIQSPIQRKLGWGVIPSGVMLPSTSFWADHPILKLDRWVL